MISFLLTTLPIGIQDTAADPLKDIDEEDTLEITLKLLQWPRYFTCLLVPTPSLIDVA